MSEAIQFATPEELDKMQVFNPHSHAARAVYEWKCAVVLSRSGAENNSLVPVCYCSAIKRFCMFFITYSKLYPTLWIYTTAFGGLLEKSGVQLEDEDRALIRELDFYILSTYKDDNPVGQGLEAVRLDKIFPQLWRLERICRELYLKCLPYADAELPMEFPPRPRNLWL